MLEKDLEIKSTNKKRRKLVDYFNQWREEKFGEKGHFKYTNRFDEVHLVSKKMGFIEWLVSKDKIAYDRYIKEFMMKDFGKFYYMSKAEVVIANLSIQNDPINFLISILK